MAWRTCEVPRALVLFSCFEGPLFPIADFFLPLADDEFFFVDPDAKLSKVAPEGWKDDPRKKKSDVPFNLFLRIKFFLDDVNLIQ